MDIVKKALGGGSSPQTGAASPTTSVHQLESIRGLNRDWLELGCEKDATTVPCSNILEAMARLSLPAAKRTKETLDPKVELGPAKVASKPPTLVSQRDAHDQAACTKRCGIVGAVLGAALSSPAISGNLVADLGIAKEQSEIVAQAGAAAASVVAVTLCSRFCEPGRKQQTFEAPGVGYKLKGEYVHTLQSKKEVDDFIAAQKPK